MLYRRFNDIAQSYIWLASVNLLLIAIVAAILESYGGHGEALSSSHLIPLLLLQDLLLLQLLLLEELIIGLRIALSHHITAQRGLISWWFTSFTILGALRGHYDGDTWWDGFWFSTWLLESIVLFIFDSGCILTIKTVLLSFSSKLELFNRLTSGDRAIRWDNCFTSFLVCSLRIAVPRLRHISSTLLDHDPFTSQWTTLHHRLDVLLWWGDQMSLVHYFVWFFLLLDDL